MRTAVVLKHKHIAGYLQETEKGYQFQYAEDYLKTPKATPLSKTLPLKAEAYESNILFPFFDGLIPEGWLLHIAEENWKVNPRDRMGLLLTCCRDCIGAVSIETAKSEDNA